MQTCTGNFISLKIGAGSTETGNNGATDGKSKTQIQRKSDTGVSGSKRTGT
jgi:hypothetical protein